jgi:hypothetical protein
MLKTVATFFTILLLAACSLPPSTPETQTAPANSRNCSYVWATQPLPDLTAKVQSAFNAAGLKDIQASAQAYGENCIDPQTNKIIRFSSMETDFRITVPVADLTNIDNLGSLLEKILVVLDTFPAGKVPGPRPGNIYIFFQSGSENLNLMFTAAAGKTARSLGLHGAELLKELQKK